MKYFLIFFLATMSLRADSGVLLPGDQKQPNPALLSLEEMSIDVRIDNGHSRVRIRQIFASHSAVVLEGTYIFTLPGRSIVSDFAVWDDLTRIPGVILERKRAEELYSQIRNQAIDPGLLQQGEQDADERHRTAIFTAKVAPIPAYGTKRIEMEYTEQLAVERFQSQLAIPLRPDAYRLQSVGRLTVHFDLVSAHALKDFQVVSKAYPIQIADRKPNRVQFDFVGTQVKLSEDLTLRYELESKGGDQLEIITHRDPTPAAPDLTDTSPPPAEKVPGFFEASALIAGYRTSAGAPRTPKTIVALFDNSLSMQWEKLERSHQALESLLRSLKPVDRFNLLLFNSNVEPMGPEAVMAIPPNVEKALAFVKASRLRGGTNLQAALAAGLAQSVGPDSYLVVITDGGATRGIIQNGKLAQWYTSQWKATPAVRRPSTYVFAVGDDANASLLKSLAANGGVLEWVRSTEPAEFKLNGFLDKIGRHPLEAMKLTAPSTELVYPLSQATFPGSVHSWVGQYATPQARADFSATGLRDGKAVRLEASAPLPRQNLSHPDLPGVWAKARVDALLDKIDRDGEDQASIDEVIKLSRKYKFITPYTSFLAAPRALLRPRLIRPGDPLLRVKTDSSIVSVVALFAFGPVRPLRYLSQEDTWQTRFLAPADLADGVHEVRLILRDTKGTVYQESKTFVIASKPPIVRVKLDKSTVRRGDNLGMRVSASENTRTITARMYGAQPVRLTWNSGLASNTGALVIPAALAPGRYTITVTAEDFAHNIGSREVSIEVQP